ncbi:MAG TPA: DUF2254 domain-containing protein [Longimicrobiales bacterium]|nr:DUF2254 domain-containing protein [Longimicrobiales bacterium]
MTKLGAYWKRLQESLWFVPGLCTVGALLLSFATVEVDRGYLRGWDLPGWVFLAGAEGVQGMLTAIAGSLITVTGVVFSVTIVALQLASSQFTPRVLRNFTADRANQVVLGVFIGTFTYAMMVLRVVRLPVGGGDAFVPALSAIVAGLLALISIGFLIFFIDHLARAIQAEVILELVADQTEKVAERIFPREPETDEGLEPSPPPAQPGSVPSSRAGYLQAIDEERLLEIAAEHGLTLRVELLVGEFLLVGSPVVAVWPAVAVQDGLSHEIRQGLVIGTERTPHQDVGRGILEISDLAVKALSPGINDPTTALVCVDRLAQVLLAIGRGHERPGWRRAEDEEARLFLPRPSFEDALRQGFGPIAFYGAEHPRVLRRLLEQLARLAALLPPTRRPALLRQVEVVEERARAHLERADGLESVQAAVAAARAACAA